jgi:aminoglycoside 6'-N-acetyltransferase I
MKISPIKTQQQLAACVELYVAVFNAAPWNDQWTPTTASQRLADAYHAPGFIGLTAVVDQQIVGALVGNLEHFYTGPYFNLKEMFVCVSLQRQGIGEQLLVVLEQQLRQRQITSILLFTAQDFFPYAFYQQHGFHEISGLRMLSKTWGA